MKSLFFLFFFIPIFSSAQICDSLIKAIPDKFTDKTDYDMNIPVTITKDGSKSIMVNMIKLDGGTVVISMHALAKGFGCTDEDQNIYFLFTDGTKYQSKNGGSFACDGGSFIFLTGKIGDKKLSTYLLEKTLSALKVNSRNSSVQGDLDLEDALRLRDATKCLIK